MSGDLESDEEEMGAAGGEVKDMADVVFSKHTGKLPHS